MSSYLINKYKGTYQLRAEIDQRTGDYCRDENGKLENYLDIWIACDGKGKVFNYGNGVLQYYIPRLVKGKSIIKEINAANNKLIFDIEESDKEILFKFKAVNMNTLEKYIKPKTSCAKRSPFSQKNLPRNKNKYTIPIEDLALYKEITSLIPKGNVRIYVNMNNGFIDKMATKKHSVEAIKGEIRKSGIGQKNWFHSKGLWDKYLEFIKKYLKENL